MCKNVTKVLTCCATIIYDVDKNVDKVPETLHRAVDSLRKNTHLQIVINKRKQHSIVDNAKMIWVSDVVVFHNNWQMVL